MQKMLGWAVAWGLYAMGHAVSLCMHTRFTGWLYPAYNRLLVASADVQDWSGAEGPWGEVV